MNNCRLGIIGQFVGIALLLYGLIPCVVFIVGEPGLLFWVPERAYGSPYLGAVQTLGPQEWLYVGLCMMLLGGLLFAMGCRCQAKAEQGIDVSNESTVVRTNWIARMQRGALKLVIMLVLTIVLYIGMFSYWWLRSETNTYPMGDRQRWEVRFEFNALTYHAAPVWAPAWWWMQKVCGYGYGDWGIGPLASDTICTYAKSLKRDPQFSGLVFRPWDTVRAQRISCVNNLKQIGLAFQVFEGDNADHYPFNLSTNAGGTLELCARGADGFDSNGALHFQVMSNELNTPKILVCPNDHSKMQTNSFGDLTAANVTYRLRTGTNITAAHPKEILVVCPIDGNTLYTDGTVTGEIDDSRAMRPR